jgi:hypothetical protein
MVAAGATAESGSGKQLRQRLDLLNPPALQRAADYLATTWPAVCGPQLPGWKKDLDQLQGCLEDLRQRLARDDSQAIAQTRAALELQRRILLANPLLHDFSSVLLVRRSANSPNLGLPQNWESNCALPRTGYHNDLAVLALSSPEAPLTTLYRPANDTFVGDVDLHCTSSYWPNGVFFARPIPGHPTQVAGIVTGHHGVPRMGELVIFDPQLGRSEAEGVVQRIPGWGKKVERVVKDAVADASWPKFLHPYPLGRPNGEGSGKCFLVACQPTPESLWGIYLVDVFDNRLLLREEPDYALLEPVPTQQRPAPPVIPDRVQPERTNSLVYLVDVYAGPGLRGIPRGEVKALRVFTYVYGYRGMGGLYGTIGLNGPWDIRYPTHSSRSCAFPGIKQWHSAHGYPRALV